MDCAICHKKHTFDQCPILNDIPYIKKHFVSYYILMNPTQKQMLSTIHRIDANWDTENNDDDCDEDFSHGNTDNDVDF